jgi:hypothetical protein
MVKPVDMGIEIGRGFLCSIWTDMLVGFFSLYGVRVYT